MAPHLVRILLIGFYVLVLSAPTANMLWGFVKEAPLTGATEKKERPALRASTFTKEEFQKDFVAWYESNYGARGSVVRLDNSLEYFVFDETPIDSTLRVGRGKTLYHCEDLAYYNRTALPKEQDVIDVARSVKRVQDALMKRGKVLVPVIVPAKTSIRPEDVPGAFARDRGLPRPSDAVYRTFVTALERSGVVFVDGRRVLLEAQSSPRTSMYGRTGRHWTSAGACLVLEEVFRSARPKLPSSEIVPLDCGYTVGDAASIDHDDYDLFRLLNVWHIDDVPGPIPLMHAVPERVDPSRRPTVLFIGSSFLWPIIRDSERNHALGRAHFYYYNSLLYDRNEPHMYGIKIVPNTPEWKALTLSKDLYVIDFPEMYLPTHAGDFLKQLETLLAE